jgi:hypothetical protein
MENFENIFLEALKYHLPKRGGAKKIAFKSGISAPYFSLIINGLRTCSDNVKRKIAAVLGYPDRQYEDFLEIGRIILAGGDPDDVGEDWNGLSGDELRDRGFITVPFSDNMKLAAGSGGVIPITEDINTSNIVIHGPSLGRITSRNLQAFRVGGDSMEPVIAQNGIVLADISENSSERIKSGKIYVLCWDMQEQECAVKFVTLGNDGKTIVLTSPNYEVYPPITRRLSEVQIIGRVIWAWREFK